MLTTTRPNATRMSDERDGCDSVESVDAYEAIDWLPLLKHNLVDIQRTRELAQLADRYVPQSILG